MTLSLYKSESLIAPCGLDCGGCIAYLREKNQCPGCRMSMKGISKYHQNCVIKNCQQIASSKSGFCYECPTFPCKRLKNLDKRYRTKYHTNLLENLEVIKTKGLQAFVRQNTERWTCAECGAHLSVHRMHCLECGAQILFE